MARPFRPLVTPLAPIALAVLAPAAAQAAGQVRAGAYVLDGTYHVGNSAGQYASTRDQGYGDVDPNAQEVKNQASYGVEARESVRALVVKGSDGKYIAMVSDDHYIPEDALWRRTAQLLEADPDMHGAITEKNLTMTITHNHSSPSYSSFDWGVWTFQDVFDFRFFDYYAHQNELAVKKAFQNMHDVRVSATVSHFDAFQKNPMTPNWGDVGDILKQRPNPDDQPTPYGGTSYHDRFVPWMSDFPVSMDDRWFPGPISHPYPGVSSCRTDPAFQGDPRLPLVGLPDCQDMP